MEDRMLLAICEQLTEEERQIVKKYKRLFLKVYNQTRIRIFNQLMLKYKDC